MKKNILLLCVAIVLFSCQKKVEVAKESYASFGDSISKDGAISKETMFAKYAGMKDGDTINVKFE